MSKKKRHEIPKSEVKVVKNKTIDNQERIIVISILILGFILRLVYVFDTISSPFYLNLFSDSKIYFDWAKQIATSGNWLGDSVFFMSPGYPYFLSAIFIFLGPSILAIRIIQVLISTITIFFIYLSAKNLFGRNSGYFAAGLTSIFSLFIFYSGTILGETVQIFLISYLCVLLSKNKIEGKTKHWFKVGLTLSVAALFRANILIFAIVILVFMIFKSLRKEIEIKTVRTIMLSFFAGLIIPLVIVTSRNYFVGGDFVAISSNGGINFFIGNNESSPGVYLTPKGFDLYKDMSGEKFAEKITGRNLNSAEVSNYWFSRGRDYIFSHPADALILFGKKILLFFDDDENPQSSTTDINFFRENYSILLKLPFPGFLFILLLAAIGVYFSWKNKKPVQFLILLLLSLILSTAIFFVIGRFRLVAVPILIIFAGFGISELINIIKAKRFLELTKPIIILLLIIAVQFIIPKFNYSNYEAWSNLADVYFQNKEFDEALINAQKSLALKKTDFGFVLLANTYAAKGNNQAAAENYKNAIRLNPESPLAYFNFGLFFTQQGNFDDALVNYNLATKFDPTFAEAYRNMAIIYYMTENYEQSLKFFEKYLSLISDEQIKTTVLQDISEIKKRLIEQK